MLAPIVSSPNHPNHPNRPSHPNKPDNSNNRFGYLPRHASLQSAPGDGRSRPETEAASGGAKSHAQPVRVVLIVEDNPDLLETTSCLLELSGFSILRAATGREGLQVAHDQVPDVALIDVGLPDISGFDVAAQLRADPSTRHIYLVALTGFGAPEDVQQALAAGFDIHMTKPLTFERLVDAITRPGHRT